MPLTKVMDIEPHIAVYTDPDGKAEKVIKRETMQSAMRALIGYTAVFMAGASKSIAPFRLRGKRPLAAASDWRPIDVGNGVEIVPGCGKGKLPVVPNTLRITFQHKTLDVTHAPEFVRPVLPFAKDIVTVNDFGVCGTKLIAGSKVAKRALKTISDTVVEMAKHQVFPTDLKLANFVYFWTIPSEEDPIGTARFIDYEQFTTSRDEHFRSCSFFLELSFYSRRNRRLFEEALSNPDIHSVFMQAQQSIEGKAPQFTATLGMNLLMRAILAFLNLQLRADLIIPSELSVRAEEDVYWKCYIGASPLFDKHVWA